ncbi:MAG: hypothetical protein EOO41_01010, partial [Methanobacteriota archaeon]
MEPLSLAAGGAIRTLLHMNGSWLAAPAALLASVSKSMGRRRHSSVLDAHILPRARMRVAGDSSDAAGVSRPARVRSGSAPASSRPAAAAAAAAPHAAPAAADDARATVEAHAIEGCLADTSEADGTRQPAARFVRVPSLDLRGNSSSSLRTALTRLSADAHHHEEQQLHLVQVSSPDAAGAAVSAAGANRQTDEEVSSAGAATASSSKSRGAGGGGGFATLASSFSVILRSGSTRALRARAARAKRESMSGMTPRLQRASLIPQPLSTLAAGGVGGAGISSTLLSVTTASGSSGSVRGDGLASTASGAPACVSSSALWAGTPGTTTSAASSLPPLPARRVSMGTGMVGALAVLPQAVALSRGSVSTSCLHLSPWTALAVLLSTDVTPVLDAFDVFPGDVHYWLARAQARAHLEAYIRSHLVQYAAGALPALPPFSPFAALTALYVNRLPAAFEEAVTELPLVEDEPPARERKLKGSLLFGLLDAAECVEAGSIFFDTHFKQPLIRQLFHFKPNSYWWQETERMVGSAATRAARIEWQPRLAAYAAQREAHEAELHRQWAAAARAAPSASVAEVAKLFSHAHVK